MNKRINFLFKILLFFSIIWLSACGGSNAGSGKPTSSKNITAFSVNGVSATITGNTISTILPYGSDLTAIKAIFSTTGEVVAIGDIIQVSGETVNNFSKSLVYTVHAADGSSQNYKVNVTIASSSAKNITAFAINGILGTIISSNISIILPHGSNLTSAIAEFTTSGQHVKIGNIDQSSGMTSNDFSKPLVYTVYAADGSTQDYTVNVTLASSSAKAITDFALNGVSGTIVGNTITVILPYGSDLTSAVAEFTTSGQHVMVGNVDQNSGMTPNDFSEPLAYTVYAADGSTRNYKVNVTVALNTANDITDFSLNGTPGIIIGNTISVTLPYSDTGRLTSSIAEFTTSGQSVTIENIDQASGLTPNDFSNPVIYTVRAADGSTQNYTVNVTVALNTANDITDFSLNGTPAIIIGNTITVVLPYNDADKLTSSIAEFTTTGQRVVVGNTEQASGLTPNDFSNPVIYTVYAADGSTQNYTVNVTVALNTAKDLTYFALDGTPGTITGNTITVTLPYGSDVITPIADFTTTGQRVTVGNTEQTSGLTPNNFSNSVIYTVHAADGSIQNYTVNVTLLPPIIFVSPHARTGNLGGFLGADAKCNNGAIELGYEGNFKALLNGNDATTAGVTYYRPDHTTIIATATGGNLNSTLENAISDNSVEVWTGMESSENNCSNWTSASSSDQGTVGLSADKYNTWGVVYNQSCDRVNVHLYCVQQKQ